MEQIPFLSNKSMRNDKPITNYQMIKRQKHLT